MKLNKEAIETVQQLIKDLETDLKAVEESHPLSEGRFADVYLSINSARDFIIEIESNIKDTSAESLYAIHREIIR